MLTWSLCEEISVLILLLTLLTGWSQEARNASWINHDSDLSPPPMMTHHVFVNWQLIS